MARAMIDNLLFTSKNQLGILRGEDRTPQQTINFNKDQTLIK